MKPTRYEDGLELAYQLTKDSQLKEIKKITVSVNRKILHYITKIMIKALFTAGCIFRELTTKKRDKK